MGYGFGIGNDWVGCDIKNLMKCNVENNGCLVWESSLCFDFEWLVRVLKTTSQEI